MTGWVAFHTLTMAKRFEEDEMNQVTDTGPDQRALRNVRIIIGLAIAAVLIAIASGVILLIAEPASGSTAESALGITAAISGLATAVLVIGAAIYAQVKDLWRYAPTWIRVAAWVLIAIGLARTVWSWIT